MSESIFSGEVLRLAFGGEGIVHHQEGFVVFVPFTVPGDYVKYRIIQRKKNFAHGELIDIVQSSPDRIVPRCPYFGVCGGCQLQHLDYAAQLECKRQSIQDALVRQAKLIDIIVPPVVPATQQWAYRRRINLRLKNVQGHFVAGYTAVDGVSLLPVTQCPIFTDSKDVIFSQVQTVIKDFKAQGSEEGKVALLKRGNGTFLLHFHFKHMPSNAEDVLAQAAQRYPNWKGILASSPKRTLQFGMLETDLEIGNLTFDVSPKAFIQNHPEQSLNIYHSLCKYAALLQPKTILDLYCGIGISSLMLARQELHLEKVIGVEANKEAVRLAQINARKNGMSLVDFIQADVQEVLSGLLDRVKPDLVIVNPPREGIAPAVIQSFIERRPPAILYISCMPSTLARDLKSLCCNSKVYQIGAVEAYDMFPQTAHVETLVHLFRN